RRPATAELVAAACAAVAARLHLVNLRRLALPEVAPTPAALAGLLAAPHLRRLEALTAWGDGLHDEQVRSLARADLPAVRQLRLGQGLTPTGASALAAARWFGQLTHLDLTANEGLGDAGLEVLLARPPEALRSLELWSCKLGARAWAALAEHGPA